MIELLIVALLVAVTIFLLFGAGRTYTSMPRSSNTVEQITYEDDHYRYEPDESTIIDADLPE